MAMSRSQIHGFFITSLIGFFLNFDSIGLFLSLITGTVGFFLSEELVQNK